MITYFFFILLYIVTFPIAWYLLAKLIVSSFNDKKSVKDYSKFVARLFAYYFVIVFPYLVLIFSGETSSIVRILAAGIATSSVVLAIVRLLGKGRLISWMWNVYSQVYDSLLRFYPYREIITQISNKIEPAKGQRIVDLGCGTGNVISKACSLGVIDKDTYVKAVDSSEAMLAVAARKSYCATVEFEKADLSVFVSRERTNSYDIIVLSNSLYTQANQEVFLGNCSRILSRGGTIIITNPDRKGSTEIIKHHIKNDKWYKLADPRLIAVGVIDNFISQVSDTNEFYFADEDSLRSLLEKSGFSIEGNVERTYGGKRFGVNLLLTARRM